MIVERVSNELMATQRVSKPSGFRASEAGHLCSRYQYHAVADWDKRPAPGEGLAWIFALGAHLERYVLDLLANAGVKVIRQQAMAEDKDLGLVGHVDGFVEVDGHAWPMEIKSVASWNWEKIQTYADMVDASTPYVLRWAAQLPLYMYLHGESRGVYLLVNKQTGQLKEVWVTVEEAWPTLQRVQDVLLEAKAALRAGTPPTPKPSTPQLCTGCWARDVGLCPGVEPEAPADAVAGLQDPSVLEAARLVAELRDTVKTYEEARERLRAAAVKLAPASPGKVEAVVGPVVVRVSTIESTRYDVPKEVKERYATKVLSTRVDVL
jgi:CRISPR/Cas system-associated exonuclease Cas4 (RecB family)